MSRRKTSVAVYWKALDEVPEDGSRGLQKQLALAIRSKLNAYYQTFAILYQMFLVAYFVVKDMAFTSDSANQGTREGLEVRLQVPH